MILIEQIRVKALEAFLILYNVKLEKSQIQIEETTIDFKGDITIVVFPLLKYSRKNPFQTACEIGEYLINHAGIIASFEVIKGFLNLEIKPDYYLNELDTLNTINEIDVVKSANKRKYLIEYSSPNTNKPLHLGHIRNNLLGHSVAKILEARGHEVIKVNLVNDRGIHICKSMLAWMKDESGKTPENTGIKGDHLVGEYYVEFDRLLKKELNLNNNLSDNEESILMKEARVLLKKWEENDPEIRSIWQMMNNWVYKGFNETYNRLGISFDKIYYESDTYLLGKSIVAEGIDKKVFYRKEDGSTWVDLTDCGFDEKLLLRSDGTSVYITQDLGTAQLKYDDFKPDISIYVVGNEQDYHFNILKQIAKKLEKPYADSIFHLSYGMVDLPDGKMKSREGTVVDADDLMDEMIRTARDYIEESGKLQDFSEDEIKVLCEKVGLAALKFFILKTDCRKRMVFNPKESIDFQGYTGPFVQYTYARICSVFRKGEINNSIDYKINLETEINGDEKLLLKKTLDFNEAIISAEEKMDPSQIANYVYQLAKLYNKFYHDNPILNEPDDHKRSFRIILSFKVRDILNFYMNLLGIQMTEKM